MDKTSRKLIVQNVLADRGEDGAEERLTEEHEGGADGDVGLGEDSLCGCIRGLRAGAEAEAVDELVAGPLGDGGGGGEGGEEAGADGGQADAEEEGRGVVPDAGDELAGEDGGEDDGEDGGEEVDAGLQGGGVLDCLEVDGEIVDLVLALVVVGKGGKWVVTEEGLMGADAAADPEAGGDAALDEDAWGEGGLLWFPNLDEAKDDEKCEGEHEQRDDAAFAPLGMCELLCPEETNKRAVAGIPSTTLTAYFVPPHCRARHRQTIPGRRASRPRALSCRSLFLSVILGMERFGMWSKKKIIAATTPPKGRLI